MDAISARHAAIEAAANAAAEDTARHAAAAAAAAAKAPSPSAAAYAASLASLAANISALAARTVASHEAAIASFARLNTVSKPAASAAAAVDERAIWAEFFPEWLRRDLEADSMLLSKLSSDNLDGPPLSELPSDNLDDPDWYPFFYDVEEFNFLDEQNPSEYCGMSDYDMEFFGLRSKNLNDPHGNTETSQIVSRLSEISMEDHLNQDSERQLTGCSMGPSTYCPK